MLVLALAGLLVATFGWYLLRDAPDTSPTAADRDATPVTEEPAASDGDVPPEAPVDDEATPARGSDDDPGTSGAPDGAERVDDEQTEVLGPETDTDDGAVVAGDAPACDAAAFERAVDGAVDGVPAESSGQMCDGDFALARFRLLEGDPAPEVFVAFTRTGNGWTPQHYSLTVECDAIRSDIADFPDSLCGAIG